MASGEHCLFQFFENILFSFYLLFFCDVFAGFHQVAEYLA